jgi:hypothetical protein
VANFDCGYNAIIGRPGLAKFMAIPHYTYMILGFTDECKTAIISSSLDDK